MPVVISILGLFPLGVIILIMVLLLRPEMSKVTWIGMAMVFFAFIFLGVGLFQIPWLALEDGLENLSLFFLWLLTFFMMLSGVGFIFLGRELEAMKEATKEP